MGLDLPLPTAAQRLYQRHRHHLPVRLQLRQRAARLERGGLGRDHFGIADLPGPVAVQ